MKFVDEFRDTAKSQFLVKEIQRIADRLKTKNKKIRLMEFCGGHTHTIFRYGIEQILPDNIEMIHGPGCPVCVLPMGRIDNCIDLAENSNAIITTFGDVMRVPGSSKSLLEAKADGADVLMVYSPLDALNIARKNPDREVVFFALGFETTMPSSAFTILQAEKENLTNFSVFCNHITTAPTIKAVLDSPSLQIDGFLAPGHVAMVIGERPFDFIANEYHKPIVITGFEPIDILQSIWMVIQQIDEKRSEVENQYKRVVLPEGNKNALDAMAKVFESHGIFELRGLGEIEHAGVSVSPKYAKYDADQKFVLQNVKVPPVESSQCGEVITGAIKPWDCKLFGIQCTPENPIGALMVSSEGACAAYYKNGYRQRIIFNLHEKR